jgi:rod shape-determining protein MreD
MRNFLILIFIFIFGIILQLTIISRITIIDGNGDLILVIICAWASQENVRHAWLWGVVGGLLVGMISAAPWYVYVFVYLSITVTSRILVRRIWQAPLLALFLVIFLGSIMSTSIIFIFRLLFDNLSLSIGNAFFEIILPSTLINMLLIIFIKPVIGHISKWAALEEISG